MKYMMVIGGTLAYWLLDLENLGLVLILAAVAVLLMVLWNYGNYEKVPPRGVVSSVQSGAVRRTRHAQGHPINPPSRTQSRDTDTFYPVFYDGGSTTCDTGGTSGDSGGSCSTD